MKVWLHGARAMNLSKKGVEFGMLETVIFIVALSILSIHGLDVMEVGL